MSRLRYTNAKGSRVANLRHAVHDLAWARAEGVDQDTGVGFATAVDSSWPVTQDKLVPRSVRVPLIAKAMQAAEADVDAKRLDEAFFEAQRMPPVQLAAGSLAVRQNIPLIPEQ